jgi:hypothetical protein
MLGRGAVTDDQSRLVVMRPLPVISQRLQGQPVLSRAGQDLLFARAVRRQLEQRMQPGGYAADLHLRHGRVQPGKQQITPPPVAQPGRSDVPVIGMGVDQVSQHQLAQRRTGGVGVPFGAAELVGQRLRCRDPAEPERGR